MIKKIKKDMQDKKLENIFHFQTNNSIIAHELNTPINLILTSVSILKENMLNITRLIQLYQEMSFRHNLELPKEINDLEIKLNLDTNTENIIKRIIQIEKGINKVSDISYNLSQSKENIKSIELKVDVNENIQDALIIADTAIHDKIKLRTEFSKLPVIKSYKGKLHQVFINLIKNAIHAINQKPILNDEFLFIKTSHINNSIIIIIRDSGIGMSLETKKKLFTEYFTTKENSKGHGLGLILCKNIIENHSGIIEVESELGKGATFTISLPIKKAN